MRELAMEEVAEVGGGNWCNVGRDAAVGAGAACGALIGFGFGGVGIGGFLGGLAGGRGFDAAMEYTTMCR